MDFGLTEEQSLLATAARDLLEREAPPTVVRRIAESADGWSPELNRVVASQGWFGLLVPEAQGGLGLGMLDAAVLLTELGRALAPVPLFSSGILATALLTLTGSPAQRRAWLPRMASGETLATVAWLEESDRLDAGGIGLRPRRARDRLRLSGAKLFVPDAHQAELLLVVVRTGPANTDDGVSVVLVPRDTPGVSLRALPTIDPTRRVFEIHFDDVVVDADQVLGHEGKASKHLERLLDLGAVALAAESQGVAERALEMAVAYAKIREQFGRPIASFQAVKHIAAECVADIEPARSLLWYAAHAQTAIPRDASRAASMAKALLGEVGERVTNRAVQMHGGIGFTWEHDLHFWFKRAKVNETAFGDPAFHRERVARLSGW